MSGLKMIQLHARMLTGSVGECFDTEAWHLCFSRFYHDPVAAQQTGDLAFAYYTAVSCSRLKRACYNCA